MNWLTRITFYLLVFTAITASASDMDTLGQNEDLTPKSTLEFEHSDRNWVIGVGGGVDVLSFSDRTDTLLANSGGNPADIFTVKDNAHIEGNFLAFLGYEWALSDNDHRKFLVALLYNYFSKTSVTGTRLSFDSADLASKYSYDIHRQALLLLAKINVLQFGSVLPYIQVGLGLARNQFSNFVNNNAPFPSSNMSFPNKTTTQFSAIVGVGFDFLAIRRFIISLGYQFGYWGNIESGETTSIAGDVLPAPINLSHALFSNQALLSMSYRFV